MPERTPPPLKLSPYAIERAIDELKRRGKAAWGATYYSQLAPLPLCQLAGRPRQVQYGALISWLKRLSEDARPDPEGALELVAHLTHMNQDDVELWAARDAITPKARVPGERSSFRDGRLEVNCPGIVHDHRFVIVGELPREHLYPLVVVQPVDGAGLWYPQVARNNPLLAGRAFACFVQLGNPAGIWHIKRPPLDANVRVFALEREWSVEATERLTEDDLHQKVGHLGVVDQKDSFTSRVTTDPIMPSLRDAAAFSVTALVHDEPQVRTCVAPLRIDWKGGASYIEVRDGSGDKLLFQGTAAPGARFSLRGEVPEVGSEPALFELPGAGRYRVRLFPGGRSFLDAPFEWWLEVKGG
jgi:hypothetical protein